MSRLRRHLGQRPLWVMLFGATVIIWSGAALVSITAPTYETGSDPTTIPVAAVVSPLLAMLAHGRRRGCRHPRRYTAVSSSSIESCISSVSRHTSGTSSRQATKPKSRLPL